MDILLYALPSTLVCDENKTEKEIKLRKRLFKSSLFLFVSLYKCGIVYIIEEKQEDKDRNDMQKWMVLAKRQIFMESAGNLESTQ